jgi:Caspase domain/RNA binding activity-knot of a chromodomain
MKKWSLLLLTGFLYLSVPATPANISFDPSNSFILITGVLRWEDPSLSPFNNRNRKDEELYQFFRQQGVPASNIIFLKDEQATLSGIQLAMKSLLGKSNARSSFIFYYAGHGVRTGNGPVSFANYDYASGREFAVSTVSTAVNSYFKGNNVWLLADCCYSGALLEEAKTISSTGKSVIAFTSSSSSNISTGNWTFSQTMIDCLSGLAPGDRNADGKITLSEVKAELFDAMKYREKQLSGTVFYNMSESSVFNILPVKSTVTPVVPAYIYVQQENKFQPARVLGYSGNNVTGELYYYCDKVKVTVPLTKTKPIAFAEYPVGMKVQVEWHGKYYPAVIKESRNGFHYIQYTGYDESWNEWVMYSRINTGNKKAYNIEWNGQWYPGEILQEKDGKYFVQYTGFGSDWDEWVTKNRVKQ